MVRFGGEGACTRRGEAVGGGVRRLLSGCSAVARRGLGGGSAVARRLLGGHQASSSNPSFTKPPTPPSKTRTFLNPAL